jgi:hypothetical protein
MRATYVHPTHISALLKAVEDRMVELTNEAGKTTVYWDAETEKLAAALAPIVEEARHLKYAAEFLESRASSVRLPGL